MEVSERSVEVLRIRDDGSVVTCLAYIRQPEMEPDPADSRKKRYVIDEATGMYKFAERSRLRTRMLTAYLRKDVVIDIPKKLLSEIRDEFFEYEKHYRFRGDPAFTSVINQVTDVDTNKNCPLEYPVGRKRMALLYLQAYRFLKQYEKAEMRSHELLDYDDDEACYG